MKYLVIVLKRNIESINWHNLYQPATHKLIIITTAQGVYYIQKSLARNIFYHVFSTEKFEARDICKTLLEFAKHENINNELAQKMLIATNDEQGLIACAEVRKRLGLPGTTINELLRFRNKIIMKQSLAKQPQLLPKHISYDHLEFESNKELYVNNIEEHLQYPIFIKPILDGGSRKTQFIKNRFDLLNWCLHAENYIAYELDQYIDGTLFHCDSIVKDNKILCFYASENNLPCAEFCNGKACGSFLLLPDNPRYNELEHLNKLILDQLAPIPDGCTHLELFYTHSREYVFLEIAARSPGALIPEMYKTWQGIDFREAQLKLQLTLPFTAAVDAGPYAAWLWYPTKTGVLTKINKPLHLSSAINITWNYNLGQNLPKPSGLLDYACAVIISNYNYTQLLDDFNFLKNYEMFEVTPSAGIYANIV